MRTLPAPAANVRPDFGPYGPNLRRAIWRKAAALQRQEAANTLPPSPDRDATDRFWAEIRLLARVRARRAS